MTTEDSAGISPFGMLLAAQRDMHDELKQHRILFSEIKDNISEQRQMHASLVSSINNLAESIDRHEHIFEKVLAIESWRSSTKLEERVSVLESWRVGQDLQQANWKGRAVILFGAGTAVISLLVYVSNMLVTNFFK